jgi:hypothetical protein
VRKRGRPSKLGPSQIQAMRLEWTVRSTAYWAHRFGVCEGTIERAAFLNKFPHKVRGPKERVATSWQSLPAKPLRPRRFRCRSCGQVFTGTQHQCHQPIPRLPWEA